MLLSEHTVLKHRANLLSNELRALLPDDHRGRDAHRHKVRNALSPASPRRRTADARDATSGVRSEARPASAELNQRAYPFAGVDTAVQTVRGYGRCRCRRATETGGARRSLRNAPNRELPVLACYVRRSRARFNDAYCQPCFCMAALHAATKARISPAEATTVAMSVPPSMISRSSHPTDASRPRTSRSSCAGPSA